MSSDWICTVYDDKDEIIDTFTIENRTENEASKEASSYIERVHPGCGDWSLSRVPAGNQTIDDMERDAAIAFGYDGWEEDDYDSMAQQK
jgi:hypothetical protein